MALGWTSAPRGAAWPWTHVLGHTGPCRDLDPQKGNDKEQCHRDSKNAGAAAVEISTTTPYVSLLSVGKNLAGRCPGLWRQPKLSHKWRW